MTIFHRLCFSISLLGMVNSVQAEADLPQHPEPEIFFVEESQWQPPAMAVPVDLDLMSESRSVEVVGSETHQAEVSLGEKLVAPSKEAVRKAWSSTRETGAEWAEKSSDSASRAGAAVARVTNNSLQAGSEAWDATRQYSTELWEKGQRVGVVVKREIVGVDGPVAEVIDKSVPLER